MNTAVSNASNTRYVKRSSLDLIRAHPAGNVILIAPTDKQQLIAPLKAAHDAGIPVITVDTFIDDGRYQDGVGEGDYPLSYIASDNVLGGFMAGVALANAIGERGKVYVSNVKPGISTTDQREEGFKLAMQQYANIDVLETQFNDDDANKSASQVQAVAKKQVGQQALALGLPLALPPRHPQHFERWRSHWHWRWHCR